MAQQIVVCPHRVLLVSNKKGQTADTLSDLDESPEHYAKLKKLICKDSTLLYDYNYVTFSKCQNYRDGEPISDFQEWGEGGSREKWVRLQKDNVKPPCEMFCIFTILTLVSWLWYHIIVVQGVIFGETG